MKSVGKRGKKTHDTGTHPSDVPVMMSLKRLFDWEVSLRGDTVNSTVDVLTSLIEDKERLYGKR